MFPGGVYDRWEEYLEKGYTKAFGLQDKLNYQRVQLIKNSGGFSRGGGRNAQPTIKPQSVRCELCKVELRDPEEFIAHCRKDPIHMAL